VTLHAYNVRGQYFNRFATTVDKKTCSIKVQDLSPIDADATSLDGLVCITKEEYSKMKSQLKAECENAKNL